MTHLFPNFLADDSEYSQAEAFWARLWAEIPEADRRCHGWRAGWFQRQPMKDGNPIFTAVSEAERRGIRVIQCEPTCAEPEFDYWLDTFGGDADEQDTIRELVIACALSDETVRMASEVMSSWVRGEAILPTGASANPATRG